jgi:hypothetical protein
MFTLEPLTMKTVPKAIELGQELHGYGSYSDIPFVMDTIRANVTAAIDMPDVWFVRLTHDDETGYDGVMAGSLSPCLFNPGSMAIESLLFVRDVRDRTKKGVSLVRAFIAWATVRKALRIQTGDIASINCAAVDAMYRHMGFARVGTIYSYKGLLPNGTN